MIAALPHYEKTGNRMLIALAHNNIGHCAAEVGDSEHGRLSAARALEMLHELGDRHGEATALDTLARVEYRSGNHTAAITHYERAVELYRAADDDYSTANTLMTLGHTHLALGQHERAAAIWRRALDMLEQQGRDEEAGRLRDRLDCV